MIQTFYKRFQGVLVSFIIAKGHNCRTCIVLTKASRMLTGSLGLMQVAYKYKRKYNYNYN